MATPDADRFAAWHHAATTALTRSLDTVDAAEVDADVERVMAALTGRSITHLLVLFCVCFEKFLRTIPNDVLREEALDLLFLTVRKRSRTT